MSPIAWEGPIAQAATQATPDDGTHAVDEPAFAQPLFDVFAAVAARQQDQYALDDGTACLSYGELRDRAASLGARIAALVPADGLVGIALPITVLYPVAWLACMAARRAFLPLDASLPPAHNQAIIAEAGLAAAIVPTATAHRPAWLPVGVTCIGAAVERGPDPPALAPGRPAAEVGMVVFTSGSTGRAKGIALHERSTLRKALHYRRVGLGPRDRLLSLHPPTTSAGVRDTFGALLCGAKLHLVDLKREGLARVLTLLRSDSVTVCATVPSVARALMAMDGAADAFRGLRIMRLGGDVVMDSDIAALARRLPPTARILVSFGMTEAGGALIQRVIDPGAPLESGRIAMGRPVAGQTVSVEDAHGTPVGPGETGELVIRGRYVALGHWVGGKLDPTEFPTDPSEPGSRCFRSADRFLSRQDGLLVPLGRADRQVKVNGIRIEPGETEAALRTLPGVADAAVVVHGGAGAPVLVAFVVPAPGKTLFPHFDAQRTRPWRKALAVLLPPQLVPARIRVVPALPLLPSMKPDLAALRALLDADADADAVANGQGIVATTWTRLRHAAPRARAALQRRSPRRGGAVP